MKLFRRYCCITICIFFTHLIQAQQKEANIWYFGNFLGIDFNSGTAVPLNDGRTFTDEGVATISDANGRLLFYTDGQTIWNRNHHVMPNGNGLFGSFSSTQSAVVVPFINDANRYYVFTVDLQNGPNGLCYSIVNMTLAGGNGDVETKNVSLQSSVVEKITAIRHCNNRDVWVLVHGSGSDIYYAFLVAGTGVSPTPVVSHTGITLSGTIFSTIGYMKVSPDGSKLAAAHEDGGVDVSDFNNATGVVSNTYPLFLPSESHYGAYGVEFSPNSKLLYTSIFAKDPVNAQTRAWLFQYDITLGTAAAISSSKHVISQQSTTDLAYSALQIAPDGKIYVSMRVQPFVNVISNPNVYGPGCNYVIKAVEYSLLNQRCTLGLPTFIQSYFYPPDSFTYNTSCPGSTFQFKYIPSPKVLSVKWNFNDPGSGANNSSSENNPTHLFSAPGNYTVELIKFTNCGSDTLRKQIIADTLNVNLGADINQCDNAPILLNPSPVASTNTYLWHDGSTNPSFNAINPGLYWLEVKNAMGCVKRDSINVQFRTAPVFELGPDIPVCQNETVVLNAASGTGISYIWNSGATTSSITVSQPGQYWCEANNGCVYRDTMNITSIKPAPVVDLGNNQQLCEGLTTTLNASFPGATYLWQDGSLSPTFTVSQQGNYHVTVDLDGCKDYDTVTVNYTLKPRFTIGADQYICPGTTVELKPLLDQSWQLLWQDGSTGRTYTATQPGLYSLQATNQCGSSVDEMEVLKGVCKVSIPSAFTPNNDGMNDVFKALGTETVSQLQLRIYNRWGTVVFETTDKTKGWDGTLHGKQLDAGVFIYMISFTDINVAAPQFLKGTVTLVR